MEKSRVEFNPQHIVTIEGFDFELITKYKWMRDERPHWERLFNNIVFNQPMDYTGFHEEYMIQAAFGKQIKSWRKLSVEQVKQLEKDPSIIIEDWKVLRKPKVEIKLIDGRVLTIYGESKADVDVMRKNLREEASLYVFSTMSEITNVKAIHLQ